MNPRLGFGAFSTAQRTIQGYEAMHMFHKGQLKGIAQGNVLAQNCFIKELFGVATSREFTSLSSRSHELLQHNLRQ